MNNKFRKKCLTATSGQEKVESSAHQPDILIFPWGTRPDMCLDSWISLLLSTIQYLQQTRIKLFKIWIFKKSISNVYSTLYKASLAVLLDIGVIPDECHTCPSNFELCEPFQLNQMYMFEIYSIFLALICDI